MERTPGQLFRAAYALNRLAKKAPAHRKMVLLKHAKRFRQVARMKLLQAERASQRDA